MIYGTTIGVIKGDTRGLDYSSYSNSRGFPKIRGAILGVPVIRVTVLLRLYLYWGPHEPWTKFVVYPLIGPPQHPI